VNKDAEIKINTENKYNTLDCFLVFKQAFLKSLSMGHGMYLAL
jgi:hypothetical protein